MSGVHKSETRGKSRVGSERWIWEDVKSKRERGAAQRATESEGSWGEHKTVEAGCLVPGKMTQCASVDVAPPLSAEPESHPSWQLQTDRKSHVVQSFSNQWFLTTTKKVSLSPLSRPPARHWLHPKDKAASSTGGCKQRAKHNVLMD